MNNDTISKNQLRTELRERRRQLAPETRRSLNTRICSHIIQYVNENRYLSLAGYCAADGEADIMPALQSLHSETCSIYLPVVHPVESGRMHFAQWTLETTMARNRFGIAEPVDLPEFPARDLDLILVPLVGFTSGGERLGMGAGYFDRKLALTAGSPGPLLCGVAYGLQQVNRISADDWDVPMDAFITERGLFTCNR